MIYLNKYNINILNYMSISIDISNAGQCHMMAIEKYKTYNEGTVLVASIQLMDKENNQLTLKNRSDIVRELRSRTTLFVDTKNLSTKAGVSTIQI